MPVPSEAAGLAVIERGAVLVPLEAMMREARAAGCGVGVLLVRLGNLRPVLLGRGYAAGEQLLAMARERIAAAIRRRDRLARIGDQDFVVLLPGLLGVDQIRLCANKLLRVASAPARIGEDAVPLRLVAGGAAFPEHELAPEMLLFRAEQAAARAEEQLAPFELFTHAVQDERPPAWRIEAHFDGAFERGEFDLHYQLLIELATGRPIGAEALSRWTSAELGNVTPDLFIPVAERSGHIDRLTWSSINAALQQLAAWRAEGRVFGVAVNLSAACLGSADLADRVRNALELWNVPPAALTLEVTESAVMRDPESSFAILRALRELGVRVAIDDFGTGYSSLAYFRQLPATELKIDRSFVRGLTSSAADRHLVQTIIDLAHRFGLRVVAEGVEDAETLGVLARMGCDVGQGFHIARPVPASELAAGVTAASLRAGIMHAWSEPAPLP